MIKRLFLLALFISMPLLVLPQVEETVKQVDSLKTEFQEVKKDQADQVEDEKQELKVFKQECVEGDCENGFGTKYYESGSYKGNWKDGLRHGKGKFVWNNGDMYDGDWFEDVRQGFGIYSWHDGSKYKGNYSHGIRSGYGVYYYANGNIYEGTWQNNLKHGIANFYYTGSCNIGGKYIDNKYVEGTGITQENYPYKPN